MWLSEEGENKCLFELLFDPGLPVDIIYLWHPIARRALSEIPFMVNSHKKPRILLHKHK